MSTPLADQFNAFYDLLFEYVGPGRLTLEAQLVKLRDEVDELREAALAGDADEILKEIADVVIVALMAGRCSGFAPDQVLRAVQEKMQVNLERQWFPTASGTARHTPES